jgi:hypothetical protein
MNASVAAWLADCRAPAPSAVDLAVHVAKTTERDALLRLAIVTTNLDAKLRATRRAAEASAQLVAQHRAALSSQAHSAIVMIERMQESEPVLKALLAWMEVSEAAEDEDEADRRFADLLNAGEAYRKKVRARS